MNGCEYCSGREDRFCLGPKFLCFGSQPPPDAAAEERERYDTALAYLRCGVVSRPEAERLWGLPPGFPDQVAEKRDRQEWIEGIRRRLGLVAEVHRCLVHRGNPEWIWSCLRDGCHAAGYFCPSQAEAFGNALAHAGSFMPLPPEETPVTELDLLAFDAMWARMRDEQDRMAAALPARMEAVADVINRAGLLPEGLRFEIATTEDP